MAASQQLSQARKVVVIPRRGLESPPPERPLSVRLGISA
jgi:hypothetical protein